MLPPAPDNAEEIKAMLAAVHKATEGLDVTLTTWHQIALETAMPDDDADVAPALMSQDEPLHSMVVPVHPRHASRLKRSG